MLTIRCWTLNKKGIASESTSLDASSKQLLLLYKDKTGITIDRTYLQSGVVSSCIPHTDLHCPMNQKIMDVYVFVIKELLPINAIKFRMH